MCSKDNNKTDCANNENSVQQDNNKTDCANKASNVQQKQ